MTECYDEYCRMPASEEGTGFFICPHEHVTTEADFCGAHWLHRERSYVTWNCSRCYGKKPDGGREDWGHLCPMKLVQPAVSERMGA